MSDLLGRMIERASGRSPVVRTASHIALAPALISDATPTIAEVEVAPAAVIATPSAAPAPNAAALRTTRALTAAPPTSAAIEHAAVPLVPPNVERAESQLSTRHSADVERSPSPFTLREAADPTVAPHEPTAPRIVPIVPTEPPLISRRAEPLAAPIQQRPVATTAVDAPLMPNVLAPNLLIPRVADSEPHEPMEPQPEPVTPPRPRVMRTATMLPKLDLRQALDAVGRALAQPPRPRPAPPNAIATDGDREEVHITIGHIDVRATTPAPATSAQPTRRGPSITLAEYLRRPPGSSR